MKLIKILTLLFTTSLIAQNLNVNIAKSYGGNSYDIGNSIVKDDFGNVFTCGIFTQTVDFEAQSGIVTLVSNNNKADAFITKHDENGVLLWVKHISGEQDVDARSIITDSSGNIFVLGDYLGTIYFDGIEYYEVPWAGSGALFITKLDTNGNFEWAFDLKGERNYLKGKSLDTDSSGNIYATGTFQGTIAYTDPNTGQNVFVESSQSGNGTSPFIYKINNSGSIIYAKAVNGGLGTAIHVDNTGNIYLTGRGVGIYIPIIYKLNNQGNTIWSKSLEGNNNTFGKDITTDSNGNVFLAGSYRDTVDFDTGSNIYEMTASGGEDIFILKLDSNGDFIWVKSIGGSYFDSGSSISVDTQGDVYTTGYFSTTVDFNTDPSEVLNFTSNGESDIFIHKLDSAGNFVYAKQIGGSGADIGYSIRVDDVDDILLTGSFTNLVDFDPETTVFELDSNGTRDIFIVNFESSSLSISENQLNTNEILLFPNPSKDKILIKNNNKIQYIKLFDTNGKIIINLLVNDNQTHLNISELLSGIYILEIQLEKSKVLKRIIKI